MTYILIIILNSYYGASATHVEFNSRDACLAAAKSIAGQTPAIVQGNTYPPIVVCAPKGN